MKKVVGASSGYSLRRGVITHRPHRFWGMRLLGVGVIIAAINLGVGFYQPLTQRSVANQTTSDSITLVAKHDDTTPSAVESSDGQNQQTDTQTLGFAITQAVNGALNANSAQKWGVAVFDLDSNQWLTQINADAQMDSASTYKLFMTYALAKTKPIDQWGSVTVEGHNLKECVDLMLRISDNPCGEAVGRYVGWSTGNKLLHSFGYPSTKLNAIPSPLTTAIDTAQFMVDFYQDKLFDAATKSFVTSSLQNQKYRSGIPAGCSGCTVLNKTGNSSAVAHDVAIVKDGRHQYVVSIMSEGGSYQKIANIERAITAAMRAN